MQQGPGGFGGPGAPPGGGAPPGWGGPPQGGGPPPGWGGPPPGGGPPGGFGYGAPMGAPPGAGYEFSATENETIGKVALWAKVLAGALAVQALFSLYNGNYLGVIIEVIVIVSLFQAGQAFDSVVNSQGNDVMHLMEALDKVSTVFAIRIGLFVFAMVIALCVVIALMAAGGAALSNAF